YEDESFLNDWLKQEFKQRISQKRKIILTDKLSRAFQLVEIPVTEEMIKEEEKVIDVAMRNYQMHNFQETMKRLQENMKLNELHETMRKLRLNLGYDDNEK